VSILTWRTKNQEHIDREAERFQRIFDFFQLMLGVFFSMYPDREGPGRLIWMLHFCTAMQLMMACLLSSGTK